MNCTIKAAIAALILALGLVGSAAAGPVEDAEAAYKRHDYVTAMQLIRPLADQGIAAAQYILAIMYANGLGVPQDYAVAVTWLRKAAFRAQLLSTYAAPSFSCRFLINVGAALSRISPRIL